MSERKDADAGEWLLILALFGFGALISVTITGLLMWASVKCVLFLLKSL